MITLKTEVEIAGISGKEITDFLLNPNNENYNKWWRGTHLELHVLKSFPDHVGDIVYMDEFVGKRRVKMKGLVEEAVPGRLIVWRLKSIIRLPVRLLLKLDDNNGGVKITHITEVGFRGVGKMLDQVLKIYFSRSFEKAMNEHVKVEFERFKELRHTFEKPVLD